MSRHIPDVSHGGDNPSHGRGSVQTEIFFPDISKVVKERINAKIPVRKHKKYSMRKEILRIESTRSIL